MNRKTIHVEAVVVSMLYTGISTSGEGEQGGQEVRLPCGKRERERNRERERERERERRQTSGSAAAASRCIWSISAGLMVERETRLEGCTFRERRASFVPVHASSFGDRSFMTVEAEQQTKRTEMVCVGWGQAKGNGWEAGMA